MSGGGWHYRDGDRSYRLAGNGGTRGLLEAWAGGRYVASWVDITLACYRAEVARLLAGDDDELRRAVRRDLWGFSWGIRFERINADIMCGIENEPIPAAPPELRVAGLSSAGRIAVAQVARQYGARVARSVS